MLLYSTMEVITKAASNSLFVFIFCNLIILLLLLISSSTSEEEIPTPIRTVTDKKMNNKEKIITVEPSFDESKCLITSNAHIALKGTVAPVHESPINVESELIALPNAKHTRSVAPVYESAINVGSGQTAVTNAINTEIEDDGDEDELRRKVEEFIERVNKGWKEEKLRTHTFVHTQPELTRVCAN